MAGRGFLLALLALFGAALVFLALSGRYATVGAALGSIPILPSGGVSIASSFRTSSNANPGPGGGVDSINKQS